MKLTQRELIINFLLLTQRQHTAVEIWKSLNLAERPAKLASLSSLLKKMCDAGELRRVDGCGPRGGYGYEVNNS